MVIHCTFFVAMFPKSLKITEAKNFIVSLGDLAEVPNGGLQKRLAQAQLHRGATGIRLRARRR